MPTRLEAIAKLTAAGQPLEIREIEAIGRKIRAFTNGPQTVRDLVLSTRSEKPFFIYEDERYTFEDMWRRSCTLAGALVADYGVAKGERVAISMRNYPEWVIAFVAVTSIGGIAVAMNALWQPHELRFGLENSGAKVFLADQERLDRLAVLGEPPAGLAIIGVRATKPLPAGAKAYADVMNRPLVDAMPPVDIAPDDDAIMFYTSGSTGNPKGAVSTHRNIISAVLSWELDTQAGLLSGLIPTPPADAPQGAMLLGIPLFHVTGAHACYLTSYRLQRRLVSMYKWDAEKAAQLIARERITHFTAPSAVTGDLIAVAHAGGHDLSSLKVVGGGGAARAPEQVRAITTAFGAAVPSTGWGMTETNAIGAGTAFRDYVDHPASSGRSSVVLDLRVVDEAGKPLPTGQRGELQVRGASVMRGYWQRPDANKDAFDGDWFRTGDVAYIDDEGFVYIVDRIKDLVIRGGENIGCGAVEAALQEYPSIQEACVYGVPDERLGEEVAATVYATEPVDEADLRAFLEKRIAKFQVPRYMHFDSAPLERGATGKILKRQIREEATARLGLKK